MFLKLGDAQPNFPHKKKPRSPRKLTFSLTLDKNADLFYSCTMNFSLQNVYSLIIICAIVVQFACYGLLMLQRPSGEQRSVSSINAALILFSIGYICSYQAQSEDLLLFGLKIEYLACVALYLLFFAMLEKVFNFHYPVFVRIFVTAWFLFILVLALSIDKNGEFAFQHWFYKDFSVQNTKNGKSYLTFVDGWGRIAYTITICAFCVFSVFAFLKKVFVVPKKARPIITRIFANSFVPQIVIIVYSFYEAPTDFNFPIVPILVMIGTIISTVSVFKSEFATLYDLVLDELEEAIDDPIFISDENLFLRAANNRAIEIYQDAEKAEWMKNTVRVPQEFIPLLQSKAPPEFGEEIRTLKFDKRIFIPEIRRIAKEGRLFGFIIILNDITEQQETLTRLEIKNRHLQMENQVIKDKLVTFREKLVSGAIQFISERNPPMGDHMRRTSNYTFIIAKELQKMGAYSTILTDGYIETLCQVAPLHDVGKIFLPQDLYEKASLNQQEVQLSRSHVELGAKLVDRMIVNNPKDSYYSMARDITLYHHEWWNGTGYQKGLKGDVIPLCARIVSVADVFDTLTSRVGSVENYKFDDAIDVIKSYSGSQFDPLVVEAFIHAKERLRDIYNQSFIVN